MSIDGIPAISDISIAEKNGNDGRGCSNDDPLAFSNFSHGPPFFAIVSGRLCPAWAGSRPFFCSFFVRRASSEHFAHLRRYLISRDSCQHRFPERSYRRYVRLRREMATASNDRRCIADSENRDDGARRKR